MKIAGIFCCILLLTGLLQGGSFTVINSGLTFSPTTVTITLGDTVLFQINSFHKVIEVTQSTWNADGITALAGGFSTPFGGGMVNPASEGTHYYVCQVHASLGMKGTIIVNPPTAVRRESPSLPARMELYQNRPNPFNPSTTVSFDISQESFVSLKIYSTSGSEVATLVQGVRTPGEYTVSWNAGNLATGIYFYRLTAGSFNSTKKLLLVR